MSEKVVDYDSPWKEALEQFFPAFMSLCFPNAYAEIDWDRGYEFLDKELQQVVRDAELGRRLADKLVKVWRNDGTEAWVLIHIEVQGQPEREFSQRMYIYNYRFFDCYNRPVVSLAVLCDENPEWRPSSFEYSLWGCKAGLWFPTVKLLDYQEPEQRRVLEEGNNPFTLIILAHLEALATRNDAPRRYELKHSLTRRLLRKGFDKKDVLEIFRIIDWLLRLPKELEKKLVDEIHHWEEEQKMPFVAPFEQLAIEEGALRAKQEDVLDILEARFVTVPETIATRIKHTSDLDSLKALLRKAGTATSLEEFQGNLP